MARTTNQMALRLWDQIGDRYDNQQLSGNFSKIDAHDHTPGRGNQLVAGAFSTSLIDQAANVPSLRTLGTGAQQAAVGNDPRLSDQRTPLDGSVTTAKLVDGAVTVAKLGSTSGIVYAPEYGTKVQVRPVTGSAVATGGPGIYGGVASFVPFATACIVSFCVVQSPNPNYIDYWFMTTPGTNNGTMGISVHLTTANPTTLNFWGLAIGY